MNSTEFDHGDIFRDLQDISRSFSHLLRVVPSDGFVLRNGDDPNLNVLPDAPGFNRICRVGEIIISFVIFRKISTVQDSNFYGKESRS